MAKNASTPASAAPGMRRCAGSKSFGIEPHEAAIADFPVQPSRKDGLGAMCKPHWTEYTRLLRQAQRARQAGGEADPVDARDAAKQARSVAAEEATNAKRRDPRSKAAPAVDPDLKAATDLVASVDAMPADEYVRRIGQDDVQAALQVVAKGRGYRDPVEPVSYEA